MALNNTQNYEEQGGKKWVVGGQLVITAGGELRILGDDGVTYYKITVDANGVIQPVEV